jgi:hypothetical protein
MEIKDYFFDHGQLYDFIMDAYSFKASTGINMTDFRPSHFGFRPGTIEAFNNLNYLLWRDGGVTLLNPDCNDIRPVRWYEYEKSRTLTWYLVLPEMWGQQFPYLEIISPKEPNKYPQAFTHVAFTLPKYLTLDEMLKHYDHLDWIVDKKDSHGIIELHKNNSMQVKFHSKTVPEMLGLNPI